MDKPAPGATLDWGVGHYERTAELLRPAAEALVELAAVRPGERVLDVGSGTGNAALLAAAAGAHVTAGDPSERLLDVARTAALERHLDLTFEVGDAAALPVSDASTDCLLSSFGVIFAPDHEAAAAEMARVLARTGGSSSPSGCPVEPPVRSPRRRRSWCGQRSGHLRRRPASRGTTWLP